MQRPTVQRRPRTPLTGGVALVTAALLALTACSAGGDEEPASGLPAAQETTSPAATTPSEEQPGPGTEAEAGADASAGAGQDEDLPPIEVIPPGSPDSTVIPAGSPELVMLEPSANDNAVLGVNAETFASEGFDRVIIELTGDAAPGWFARVVTEALSPGEGAPVEVAGDSFLQLVVRGVEMPDESTFSGATLTLDGPAVTEVVASGWHAFERTFFIGVQGDTPPEVAITRTMEDHPRIVIDVAHPA